jgi:hypothetical protein
MFTPQEQQIIDYGKTNGRSLDEVRQSLRNYRSGVTAQPEPVKKQGFIQETMGDIKGIGTGVKTAFNKRLENLKGIDTAQDIGQQGVRTSAFQQLGQVAGFTSDVMGEVVKGGVKAVLPESAEKAVSGGVKGAIGAVAKTKPAQDLIAKYQALKETHPVAAREIEAALNIGNLALDVATAGAVSKGTKVVKEAVGEMIPKIGAKVAGAVESSANRARVTAEPIFGRAMKLNSVDDLITKADKALTPAETLAKTKNVTSIPSLKQKWAGISADIKNRIAGKQDKLKEYFDVAHARNNFDTLPTPLEYGAKNVDRAVTKMEEVLSDTGSNIGKFRNKVATYKANPADVQRVESSFNDGLSRLNLEIRNGTIVQRAGTVSKVNSGAELKALNELYGELQVVKQSPDLQRLIDLRNIFDSKINFAKSSRDVSSALDPLSRDVRSKIAETAANIVGPSEAGNLTKYSQFMDAYNDLKSYTDRKAGGEFLLKQVLSEKGGTPREIMQTIKEITGIDLMDDATMASIATDLIGNSRQKGLFRQELTKAGLDASKILKGDTSGAIDLMFNYGKKALVNEEKEFLKAAGEVPGVVAPKVNKSVGSATKVAETTETGPTIMDKMQEMPVGMSVKRVKPKQIDSLTKQEMVDAIDYLRTPKAEYNANIEDAIIALAEKYGIPLGLSKGSMANRLETLVSKTKTLKAGSLKGKGAIPKLEVEATKYRSAEEFVKKEVNFEWQDRRAMGGGEPLSYVTVKGKDVGGIFDASEVGDSAGVFYKRTDGTYLFNPETRTAIWNNEKSLETAVKKELTDIWNKAKKK